MSGIQQSINNNATSTVATSQQCSSENGMSSYEKVEQAISLAKIAEYIEQIARGKDAEQVVPHPAFAAKKLPPISVLDYLKRLQKYTECSNSNFLLALIFIERIQERTKEVLLNSYTVLRLILASSVVAIKYNYDQTLKNDHYAKVGGVKVDELNDLEKQFCEMIDFKLFVADEVFESYIKKFEC